MATITKRISNKNEIRYGVKIRLKNYPTQSATFTKLSEAKQWAQATETKLRQQGTTPLSPLHNHTVSQLIERYLTDVLPQKPKSLKAYTRQLRWWDSVIGTRGLDELDATLVAYHRDQLSLRDINTGKAKSPATVVRYLAALSAVCSVAVNEWQWLTVNPVSRVKKPAEPRGRVRFLNDDERTRLLAACQNAANPHLYVCVVLALSTGMRYSELMNLNWADVYLQEGYLILHQTKNGLRRRVPITGLALQLLQRHPQEPHGLVFPSSQKPTQPIDLRFHWDVALEKAQITDFRWHDLRHCTASYLAMNGASLNEIAEVLGHKSLSMVKRYAHLSDSHVSQVVASMTNKIFQNSIISP